MVRRAPTPTAVRVPGTLEVRDLPETDEEKIDVQTRERLALSEQETKRLQIMADAMTVQPQLGYARQDFDDVRHDVLRGAGDASSVSLQEVKLSRDEARVFALTPRSEAESVQLNGHYSIQKLDWQQPGQVRLWLRSTDTSIEFVATLKSDALDDDQKEKLKSAEWDRKRLYMAVNANRLRGEITSAAIVSVEWPKEPDVGAATGARR